MGLLPASLVNDPSPTSPTAKGTSDLSTWEKTRMLPVLIVKSKCFGLTLKGTWRSIAPTGISMLKIHNMDINSVFLLDRCMLVLPSPERCFGVNTTKQFQVKSFSVTWIHWMPSSMPTLLALPQLKDGCAVSVQELRSTSLTSRGTLSPNTAPQWASVVMLRAV